jgi:serine/threonine protein kinase/hemoglobin-like flavoprotein/class 3 adenylate cyclase
MRLSKQHPPGTIIGGQFEIGELLAHGGMGAVYRAVQRGTGAMRALKLMHPRLVRNPHSRELFLREAQAPALIRSEHVAQVIAAGVDDATGTPWLAMELLQGMNLAAYVAGHGPMGVREVLAVVEQICHALAAAHEQGIVHRDLKPENVFLASAHRVGTPYIVKLLDFGVAQFTDRARRESHPVGTPGYMAPEQASDTERISAATDIWPLGLLVFQMLVGRSYWRSSIEHGSHMAALWREILFDPLDLASERAAELGCEHLVPARFDEWFIRCLARDPRGRFAGARAASEALMALLAPARVDTGGEEPQFVLPPPTQPMPLIEADTVPVSPSVLMTAPHTGIPVCYRARLERTIVHARPGMTLLEVSRAHGISHSQVCGGKARCTTCRVVVLEGAGHLGARTPAELATAERKHWPESIRLACQARVLGPVTVRRLVVDTEDAALVQNEPTEPTFAEKSRACVLATSVRGLDDFLRTAMAYDAVHVVNRLISQMRDAVEQNQGQVVRCVGAELVAVFAHGEDPAAAAAHALRTALHIQVRSSLVNEYLLKNYGVQARVTLGLDASEVITGVVDGQPGHPLGEGVLAAQAAARTAARLGVRICGTERFARHFAEPLRTGQRAEAAIGSEALALVEIHDFHKPDAVHLVQSTFERVIARGAEFARGFYDQLWSRDPSIRKLFGGVNMHTQQTMLLQALESVVRAFDDLDAVREPLRALGKRHVAYGVRIGHYKSMGDALLWALQHFFGDELTPEVYRAWTDTYGKIARIMIEVHMEAAGEAAEASGEGSSDPWPVPPPLPDADGGDDPDPDDDDDGDDTVTNVP